MRLWLWLCSIRHRTSSPPFQPSLPPLATLPTPFERNLFIQIIHGKIGYLRGISQTIVKEEISV